jgi:hypothetical protein
MKAKVGGYRMITAKHFLFVAPREIFAAVSIRSEYFSLAEESHLQRSPTIRDFITMRSSNFLTCPPACFIIWKANISLGESSSKAMVGLKMTKDARLARAFLF